MTRSRTLRLPEHMADALDRRAKANHRSAQAEIIAILSAAMEPRRGGAHPALAAPYNAEEQAPVSTVGGVYTCPHCHVQEGRMHLPDCFLMRKGKSHLSAVLDDLSSTPQTPCAD